MPLRRQAATARPTTRRAAESRGMAIARVGSGARAQFIHTRSKTMGRIHFTSTTCGVAAAALIACFGAQAQNTTTRPAAGEAATTSKANNAVPLARGDRKFIE